MAVVNGTNLGLMTGADEGDLYKLPLDALLRAVDSLVMGVFIAQQTSPPGSPSDGDVYLVGNAATGDWVGQDQKVARYSVVPDIGWEFYTPKKGWRISEKVGVAGVTWEFDGSAWRRLDGLPTYADQAAAGAGGIVAGELFKTSSGQLLVKT